MRSARARLASIGTLSNLSRPGAGKQSCKKRRGWVRGLLSLVLPAVVVSTERRHNWASRAGLAGRAFRPRPLVGSRGGRHTRRHEATRRTWRPRDGPFRSPVTASRRQTAWRLAYMQTGAADVRLGPSRPSGVSRRAARRTRPGTLLPEPTVPGGRVGGSTARGSGMFVRRCGSVREPSMGLGRERPRWLGT